MHLLFQVIDTVLFAFFFYWFIVMNQRQHVRQLILEKEISYQKGVANGTNWVLDMSVEEYVNHQAIRKEEKTKS